MKDYLDFVRKPVEKIRQSVLYWNAKNTRVQSFKQYYRHNMKRARTFELDQLYQWNSTYVMQDKVTGYKSCSCIFVLVFF